MKTHYLPKRLLEKFREIGFDCNDNKVSIEQALQWLKGEEIGLFVEVEQFLSNKPSGMCLLYRYSIEHYDGSRFPYQEGGYKTAESATIAGIRYIVNLIHRLTHKAKTVR